MKNYYHCLNCFKIPNIEILKDNVLVKCSCSNEDVIFNIEDFLNQCIARCQCGNPVVYYLYNKIFYCDKCCPKEDVNLIEKNFFCKTHNSNYSSYCKDCDKNICQDCNCHKNSHIIFPDSNMKEESNSLNNFILNVRKKITELEDEIYKKKSQIFLYDTLLINDEKKNITRESIFNFKNLKIKNIIKNEKLFIEKINQMTLELKKFDYFFEYNDNYNKITQKEDIKNNNDVIKNNNMINIDFGKLYKKPEKELYERFSIKFENINDRSFSINEKICQIWADIEEKNDINLKNIFLQFVGNLARKSHIFSRQLVDILIKDLKELNPNKSWNTIIYEKAKIKLSSLYNQCLIINESNTKLKDTRNFYEYHCNKEIDKIFNENKSKNNELQKIFLNKKNDYVNLFVNLSQLYTEVLLYSDKNMILHYIDEGDFDLYNMKEITESKGKKVKYTILPGIFVNNRALKDGKILVVCESKKNKNINLKFDNPSPDINIFKIDNTIKIDNISKEISCEVLNDNNIKFTIITNPIIPKDDYATYCLKIIETKVEKKSYNNEFCFTEPLIFNQHHVQGYVIIRNQIIKSKIINLINNNENKNIKS